MAETIFSCPLCGDKISADETGLGTNLSCPRCAARITVAGENRTHTAGKNGLTFELRSKRTITTSIKSRHAGEPLSENGGPPPVTRMPEKKTLKTSVSFPGEPRENVSAPKTFKIHGCLPVFLICIGAFISMFDTGASDYTTRPEGPLLVIAGIAWAIIVPRISAWWKRK